MTEIANTKYSEAPLEKRELMLYMVGLGEGDNYQVGKHVLAQEMPYEPGRIDQELSELEEQGYLEIDPETPEDNENNDYDDGQFIYPTKLEGFNDILQGTECSEIEEETVSLTDKSHEYIDGIDLEAIENSMKYAFENSE